MKHQIVFYLAKIVAKRRFFYYTQSSVSYCSTKI